MPPKPRHSKISPSASGRWFLCPGSVRESLHVPEGPESLYAKEGTAAHAIGEHCLRHGLHPRDLGSATDPGTGVTLGPEQLAHVQTYVDFVRSVWTPGSTLHLEQKVRVWDVHEECEGTADAVVIDPTRRLLTVVDLKFGVGTLVDERENSQARIYALGAYYALSEAERAQVDIVACVICQPRCERVSEDKRIRWEVLTVRELLVWRDEVLRPRVAATEDPAAPLNPSPKACKFCPVADAGVCPAQQEAAHAAAAEVFKLAPVQALQAGGAIPDPTTLGLGRLASSLSDERIGQILKLAPVILTWIETVQKHALARATHGAYIPGRKLVLGKPGNRAWGITPAEVAGLLQSLGAPAEKIWSHVVPSPSAAEKLLPKDKKSALEPYVTRSDPSKMLVPESDKRPAIRADAASVFSVETPV